MSLVGMLHVKLQYSNIVKLHYMFYVIFLHYRTVSVSVILYFNFDTPLRNHPFKIIAHFKA